MAPTKMTFVTYCSEEEAMTKRMKEVKMRKRRRETRLIIQICLLRWRLRLKALIGSILLFFTSLSMKMVLECKLKT